VKDSFSAKSLQTVAWTDRLAIKNYGSHMVAKYSILNATFLGGDPLQPAEKLALRDDVHWLNFGRHQQFLHPGEM
jgi:hypothetical protein